MKTRKSIWDHDHGACSTVTTGDQRPEPAGRTIVAEFHKTLGKRLTLFQLTVIGEESDHIGRKWIGRTTYDVDYSRVYGYLFHQSGGGGGGPIPVSGIYFATPDAEVAESRCTLVGRKLKKMNHTRRMRRLPKEFGPDSDLLKWLQHNAIQEDAVYCSECRDFVPGNTLCEHTWWCDEIGWYSTPGEPCGCPPDADCHSR